MILPAGKIILAFSLVGAALGAALAWATEPKKAPAAPEKREPKAIEPPKPEPTPAPTPEPTKDGA